MSEIAGLDHVSLGMRRPNGEYERPIPGRRLFWTKPGMTCAYVVRYISCHGREARVIQNRCGAIIKFFTVFLIVIGTRRLELTLDNHETSTSGFVGSELRISGELHRSCMLIMMLHVPLSYQSINYYY